MKCESCGNELTGGAIICRVCNHNNALRGDWRSQRSVRQNAPRRPGDTQPNPSRITAPLTDLPKIVPRKDADANLIRFPPAPEKQPVKHEDSAKASQQPAPSSHSTTSSETGNVVYPAWRAELKERVRQIREKRNTGDLVAPAAPGEPDEDDMDRNPIVESALNRIRWSSHPPAITATVGSGAQGAGASAAAKLTQPVNEPVLEPRPQPRPEPRSTARIEPRTVPPKINQAGYPAVNQPPNPNFDKSGGQPNNPGATRPIVNRVVTRTLTPKPVPPPRARPEPPSARPEPPGARPEPPPPPPVSKILTPRTKPQTAAEPKLERRDDQRGPEAAPRPEAGRPSFNKPFTDAPEKHVETQVIEIAQAPDPLPLPEALPASLWARTIAGACDFEIVAIAYLPTFGAYAFLNDSYDSGSKLIMLLLLIGIVSIYQLVMLIFAGRTFGMAMLNLTLVNTDDESMSVTSRQMILRALTATIVFTFPPLYFFAWLSNYRRTLPDLISGTTVTE